MIGLCNEDEIILEGLSLIIMEPQRQVLSLGELKLAIMLQRKRVDFLSAAKVKETVYELVILEVFNFLISGSIKKVEGDENTTQGQLKAQIHNVANRIYNAYIANLPDSKFLMDIKSSSEEDLELLNDALKGNIEAMQSVAQFFKRAGNEPASEYWYQQFNVFALQKGGQKEDNHLASLKFVPQWLCFLLQIEDRRFSLRMAINAAKLSAFPLSLFLGLISGQLSNPTYCTYISLNGTYGICWILKSHLFPDRLSEISLYQVVKAFLALQAFFAPAIFICFHGTTFHPLFNSLCISIFTIGIYFQFVADMHLCIALEHNPGHLIKNRLFSVVRNPKYFGELLIYVSFALLTGSILGFIPLVTFLSLFWIPSIEKNESSLARYEDWDEYKSKTLKLIPFIY